MLSSLAFLFGREIYGLGSASDRNTLAAGRVTNSLVNHGLEIQDALNQLGSKPGKIANVTS